MAKKEFTEQQRLAINTTDKTLLVSAAAGSGKTATLTRRIITSIIRESDPIDINSILVVTFTNAAAGELRERIGAAVRDALAERPGDARLERQLHLLPSATISTIDSFCAGILRTNADRVGISPNFRIADEAEAHLLCEALLEALVNSIYREERPDIATPEEFEELCDALTDSKSVGKILEIFEFIYEKLLSAESGVDSILPLIELYKAEQELPPHERRYGAYAMNAVRELAAHYKALTESLCRDMRGLSGEAKLEELIRLDIANFNAVLECTDYSSMQSTLGSMRFKSKATPKTDMGDAYDKYFFMREVMKRELRELTAKYFTYSEEDWCRLYRGLYKSLSVFYRFLSEFDKIYAEEKRRRGICRYSDIERYAYECLWQGGERTEVAAALAEKYSAVYIDEYQDVNNLQNKIFEAISRPDNRFMVGDIKQSIYGFRSANPNIFAEMKTSYPPLDAAGASPYASLFMSKNFRSDEAVVAFINSVFDRIFGIFGDSIGYVRGDRLSYGKVDPDSRRMPELCVFEHGEETQFTSDDEENEEDEGLGRAEPYFVARKISELIEGETLADGSPIEPKDIAIVMRSVKGRSTVYAEALEAMGVPVQIVERKNFFLNSEVLLALCLLNSIDNPRRDVYLAGLMRSPLFGFTADELLAIRKTCPRETLYESLVAYTAEHADFSRGKSFLKLLTSYRDIAEGMNVHALISKLYHETGLLSLAAQSGGKENLILLYNYARKFEGTSFKGLYSFINYINSVINKKARFDDSHEESERNAVKIVTVHGSKGLEYPVVFFADTGREIRNKDARERMVYAEDFGIAMYLRAEGGLALVKNPVREVINSYNARANFEEELRILYVALTRARERLYITGERSKKNEDFDTEIALEKSYADAYSAKHLKSHLALILSANIENTAKMLAPADFVTVLPEIPQAQHGEEELPVQKAAMLETEEAPASNEELERLKSELIKRFSFEYPDKYLCTVPEKLSVSALYPTVLDGKDEHSAILSVGEAEDIKIRPSKDLPRFAGGLTAADESALRGIATHLYLQFCNLENLKLAGAEAELRRLLEEGFISKEDAERVRIPEIEKFRNSELFSRMLSAKRIHRELRFNIKLPAEAFTEVEARLDAISGKKILVQGVIDCIIEDKDGRLCLIDYKTDRLKDSELTNKAAAQKKLTRAHALQLSYYKAAVRRIFGRDPDTVEVYSLPLGDTVDIDTEVAPT